MQVNNCLERTMNYFLTAAVIVAMVLFAGSTLSSAVSGEFSSITNAVAARGR
jgi:Flp pilus assembly pilin Flp